jgi:YegS/Rv2252/BmrU family lipid kinase
MKTAALIFNPRAGSWQTAQRIAAIQYALGDAGFQAEPLPTDAPGHAAELAREAATGGAEVVFTHGGDGTLREAAAGLLGSETAIAPIPGGTVNVIAKALGLPLDPIRAARSMADTEVIEADVGLCGEDIFLMQASAGLDAHVMGRLEPGLKRHFGKAAVALSGLMHFTTYDYPTIDLVADARRLTATLVVICNLPYYAGSWQMAPGASVSDQILDLVIFRGKGGIQTLAFARDFVLGRHLERQDVELVRVEAVELKGSKGVEVQLDGDTLPIQLPVTITVHPERIRLLRPAAG